MLNIPETVKALLKSDGIRKNFRVQFPNGELSDLTNDDIVQESVRFTESLCSQDVLKFGLAESSVIEFETVGVANMYGMTIEAGIEIDLSSLSAADLADIAAGSWDGTYVAIADSDLGYAFFRVPYGVFLVESCPRDHQAMAHRKVTAYTPSVQQLLENPVEMIKLRSFFGGNVYDPNLYYLMLSAIGWQNPQVLYDEGFTEGAEVLYFTGNQTFPAPKTENIVAAYDTNGNSYNITLRITQAYGYTNHSDSSTTSYNLEENLYAVHMNGINSATIETMISDIAAALESHGKVNLEASGFSSYRKLAVALLTNNGNSPNAIYPSLEAWSYPTTGASTNVPVKSFSYAIKKDIYAVYPKADNGIIGPASSGSYWGDTTNYKTRICFLTPRAILVVDGSESTLSDRIYSQSLTSPSMFRYTREAAIPGQRLKLSSTLETETETGGKLYSFYNSYSLLEMVNGWLEIQALYGKMTRQGSFECFRLSAENPETIIQGNYSEFWWDEYDVLPIGTVNYTFKNEDSKTAINDDIASYKFGDGESVYDMTKNDVLQALEDLDTDTVESMLDTLFIPHLDPIAFTPIDMDMKGLPYIEAGDYIAVTAEDGTILHSFNMRHELDGIQVLTAKVESVSGEIIDSSEGEEA